MRLSLIASLVVSAALSACGTMPNWTSPSKLDPAVFSAKDTGVLVMSAGAKSSCQSMATALVAHYQETRKPVEGVVVFVDNYVHTSEVEGYHGLITALQMKPGQYFFTAGIANPFMKVEKTPEFPFEIKAGETVYLGEVYMPRSCTSSTLFTVNDRETRDVAIATKANPAVAQRPVVKRIMEIR